MNNKKKEFIDKAIKYYGKIRLVHNKDNKVIRMEITPKIYQTNDYRLIKTKDGEIFLQRKYIKEVNLKTTEYWENIEVREVEV